jgi:hypothetical protein
LKGKREYSTDPRQYNIDRRGRGNLLLILDNTTLIEGEEGIFY